MAVGYRPQLDGLRAIAIGLVIVEHFGGPLVRDHFPIGAGTLGVQLFFVLSGFLISRNLLERLDHAPPAKVVAHFFLGRALRLMPAYYLTLVILYLCRVPDVYDYIIWHVTYMSNYLAALGGPLLVFWSLAIEEQFYLLLPGLLVLAGRRGMKIALGLIITGLLTRVAVLATHIDLWSFELSIFGKLEILGSGVLIGVLAHAAHRIGRPLTLGRAWGRAALACLVFQTIAFYLYGDGLVRHLTVNITLALPCAWAVLRADADAPGWLAWLSSFGVTRFIGKISYGIYLTHTFFLRLIEPDGILNTSGLPFWAQASVVLILVFLVPALSWFLLESPLLRLKQHLLDGSAARSSRPDPLESGHGARVELG